MEGQRPLVSLSVKNWGITITSQYAFLSCLSSFMVWFLFEGTPGNISSGDGVGPVAQRIRARGYEPRCRGFESLLARNLPFWEGP
ncbi:hypothetical protein ZIOFF_040667 [Zingiber officinale]|uniref:Uncharacterized protein n=1 Tax=Zingiber officinale TaxID=94328 RepID=A0A8J5GCT8_ZINOF|nr:hypothetical protein ZIOFF_040667 [Zingiber officinale]